MLGICVMRREDHMGIYVLFALFNSIIFEDMFLANTQIAGVPSSQVLSYQSFLRMSILVRDRGSTVR